MKTYKVIEAFDWSRFEEKLNEASKQGWELCSEPFPHHTLIHTADGSSKEPTLVAVMERRI